MPTDNQVQLQQIYALQQMYAKVAELRARLNSVRGASTPEPRTETLSETELASLSELELKQRVGEVAILLAGLEARVQTLGSATAPWRSIGIILGVVVFVLVLLSILIVILQNM